MSTIQVVPGTLLSAAGVIYPGDQHHYGSHFGEEDTKAYELVYEPVQGSRARKGGAGIGTQAF